MNFLVGSQCFFNKFEDFQPKDIEHLELVDNHLYKKVIYDAYVQNNDFYLTEEQLQDAYNIYEKYRKNNK